MTTKEAVIEIIRQMPDEASLANIMSELYFRRNVEEGLQQASAGHVVSHEEAKAKLAQYSL